MLRDTLHNRAASRYTSLTKARRWALRLPGAERARVARHDEVALVCGGHMAAKRITLARLNALDRASFTQALGSLFEGPPWIVEQAWDARPFATIEALHQALCDVMYAAPAERQVALLCAHPDLVGRAALAGTLSRESTQEQAAAGLDRLTPDEIAMFQSYNAAYQERFGFPFVICARENKKESILAGFAARLGNSREQEITSGLGEVAKICALRLRDLVADDGTA